MTTVLVQNQDSYLFSSSTENGALNKSTDNSSFYVDMQSYPISIPKEAVSTSISLDYASIWNDVYNVTVGNNDQISLTITGSSLVQPMTIPPGSYSVEDLSKEINRQIINADPATFTANVISLEPDYPTGKVIIKCLNTALTDVLFNTNVRTLAFGNFLGFVSQLTLSFTAVGQYFIGSDIANINVIDFFLIHTDLVQNGIPINGFYSNTISKVPILKAPGALINYEPTNPTKVEATNLQEVIGRRTVRFWVTNEKNEAITMPSDYSFSLRIEYSMPMVLSK